jgi:hypothetical protein
MHLPSRPWWAWCSLVSLAVALRSAAVCAAAPPAELAKIRILLAIDTNSDLKESVLRDKARVQRLFSTTLPPGRYDVTILTGKKLTRANILAYYRKLKTGPREGLVFFYAGHGAMDPKKGHYFYLQQGKVKPILRSEVRKAMQDRGPGLAVLLTDCCSDSLPLKDAFVKRPIEKAKEPRTIHPTMRCLFFQARGLVDITAATTSASFSDEKDGGVFTRVLTGLLTKEVRALDTNKDNFVSWSEFFPRLQKDTETFYKLWARDMKARGFVGLELTQKPHAFALPPNLGGDKVVPGTRLYAVIAFANKSDEVVRYRYRWTGETTWQTGQIPVGKKVHHYVQLPRPDDKIRFEAKIDGISETVQLEALRWSGKGVPRYEDGWEYQLQLKK